MFYYTSLVALLAASGVAAYERLPPSPSPPPLQEDGSGPAAQPPPPPQGSLLCNLEAIEHYHTMEPCVLSATMVFQLSERMSSNTNHAVTMFIVTVVTVGALIIVCLIACCSMLRQLWQRARAPRRQAPLEAEKEQQRGVKIVYLRPDAWPIQVVGPNGDSALTKPAEAAELHSEFVSWVQMDSWVRMESPFTSSNRSSSPSSSDTSSPPPSRPAPDQPAAASQVAGRLARALFAGSPAAGAGDVIELQAARAWTTTSHRADDELRAEERDGEAGHAGSSSPSPV